MKRWTTALLILLFLAGCVAHQSARPSQNILEPVLEAPAAPPVNESVSNATGQIHIASFNLQVFGTTKVSKSDVLNILGQIIRHYDLIAIQEIRDSTGTALPALMVEVNNGGTDFKSLIGPRLGRTVSKEQYAYIFNSSKIKFIEGSDRTFPDAADIFHREPHIAKFLYSGFDFAIANIHVDPDEAESEIPRLEQVLNDIISHDPTEKDVIILGDLNADCSYYSPRVNVTPHLTWIVPDTLDTTVSSTNCAYDRILVSDGALHHFSGKLGVQTDGIVSGVSDHYLLWAEFTNDIQPQQTPIQIITDASFVKSQGTVSTSTNTQGDSCPVYASKNSNLYHRTKPICSSIKRENLVCYASVEAAKADGKTREATRC